MSIPSGAHLASCVFRYCTDVGVQVAFDHVSYDTLFMLHVLVNVGQTIVDIVRLWYCVYAARFMVNGSFTVLTAN